MTEARREELLRDLRVTPARLAALVTGLPEPVTARKPDTGVFSIRENVHHLRDIEIEGYEVRLARLLAEEDPLLPGIDGDRLARERKYNEFPIGPALAEFTRARGRSLSRLDALSAEEWNRPGRLENAGPVTPSRLIEMWRDHDLGHLADIRTLLGRSDLEAP